MDNYPSDSPGGEQLDRGHDHHLPGHGNHFSDNDTVAPPPPPFGPMPDPSSIYPPVPPTHHAPEVPATGNFGLDEPAAANSVVPQPVVQVLSPRGVEYVFLTIALFTGAIGLISVLIALVNGKADFSVLAFPVAILLVTVPVFTWLFLRLKQAELNDPSLASDASKRRSTQFTQIIAFIVCLFTLIGLVSAIFGKLSSNYNGSMVKVLLDVLVILLVAGGILAYYWADEHKPR
jgi:hypothetical protein